MACTITQKLMTDRLENEHTIKEYDYLLYEYQIIKKIVQKILTDFF